jgi:cytochrome c556
VPKLGLIAWAVLLGSLTGGCAPADRQPPAVPQNSAETAKLAALQAEVDRLKSITATQSHVMSDVAIQFGNLWFAGEKKNWPLAAFYFNETRGRLMWMVRINPTPKIPGGQTADVKAIFDGIDTGALTPLKQAIDKKDAAQFTAAYKTALESCYACHKATGRAYLRPMIPATKPQPIINVDPNANWPL